MFFLLLLSACAHSKSSDKRGGDPNSGPMEAMDHSTMGGMAPKSAAGGIQDHGPAALSKIYGIKIDSLHLTMRGEMLDLRYRIVDAKTAAQIVQEHSKIKVSLIEKQTGQVVKVAEADVGKLQARAKKLYPNRTFFILFENPHGMLKKGSEVSIVFGTVQVDGWKIE